MVPGECQDKQTESLRDFADRLPEEDGDDRDNHEAGSDEYGPPIVPSVLGRKFPSPCVDKHGLTDQ